MTEIMLGPALGAVLGLFTLLAAAVVRLGGLGDARPVITASVRAAVQLAAVSLLIAGVLRSWWWTALFLALMATVAAVTSAGRIGGVTVTTVACTTAAIAAGVGPVIALLLGTRLVPLVPIAVVPMAGIMIGNAMTATSLAGRRAIDELQDRRGEYEAALALGLLPRDAALEICRPNAGQALVPVMDQTRTVGLVTLPGAFVGMLLGGASPVQAGVVQLLVLVGLLAAQAIAVLITVELVAAGVLRSRSRRSPSRSPAVTGR